MSTTISRKPLQMVDLQGQYLHIAKEINEAIQSVIDEAAFINGPAVRAFSQDLESYTGAKHVIPCGNGTDALQLAMMALDLKPGQEVIVPTFTYVASVEVIALLGLKPVFIDADPESFNLDTGLLEKLISPKTKAILPVHLFGQCTDMESILALARHYKLAVIEDAAQAIGASYRFKDKKVKKAGTMSDIGTTSFFPSKNLGCFGDGGALFTDDESLAFRLKAIANHGQVKKYHHEMIGVNSRLDSMQAAILQVKLRHLDSYSASRRKAAARYDELLGEIPEISLPARKDYSSHVFHQYTLRVKNAKRDQLKAFLQERGVPAMVYYPLPLHLQKAYKSYGYKKGNFPVAEKLCNEVLSIPMHTELEEEQQFFISEQIKSFFHG